MKHPYRWIRAFYAAFWILPRAKHLTAISDYLRRELHGLHGYWHKIPVIPNGITSGRFCDEPKFGFKHLDRLRIYCVCEWGRRKNVITLLKAFSYVRNKIQNVELVLIGRQLGMQEEGVIWARQQNLEDGVLFRGYLDQDSIMRDLREDADLFISPTIEESLGMIFVEAMSQGIACVGGCKSGAVPWVLENGRAGYLTNVKNPKQLADTLIEVLSDPASVAHIAEQGYFRARKLFALETVAQSYVREYEHVLNQSHNELKHPRVV
jgi:glycosyltransferase involved in cell wall biosynthesis